MQSLRAERVECDSLDSYESRDPEKILGERPDVIYKTILRCFKKHYANDFNRVTDYWKMKRRVSMKKNYCFRLIVSKYLAVKFPDNSFEELQDYFTALIHTKHSSVIQKEEQFWKPDPGKLSVNQLSNLITETLYKFNKNKLKVLLNHKPLAYLLLKFLEDEEATTLIYKRSKKSDLAYSNLIQQLKRRCARVVEMPIPSAKLSEEQDRESNTGTSSETCDKSSGNSPKHPFSLDF